MSSSSEVFNKELLGELLEKATENKSINLEKFTHLVNNTLWYMYVIGRVREANAMFAEERKVDGE